MAKEIIDRLLKLKEKKSMKGAFMTLEKRLNESRVVWVDFAKIVGLFLVIFAHLYTSEGIDEKNLIRTYIYGFHMPFFFLISGFLQKRREEELRYCIKKNIQSLLVPFLSLNFFFAFYYGLTTESSIFLQLYNFLKSFYTADGTPCKASWFVIVLFYIKCIFDISIKRSSLRYIFVIAIVISFLPINLPRFFFIGPMMLGFIFFVLGFYMKSIVPKGISFELLVFWGLFCFYLSYQATCFNGKISIYGCEIHNPFLFYLSSLSGSLGIFFLSQMFARFIKKNITIISTASIGVVLLHMVFVDFAKEIRMLFPLNNIYLFFFYIFCSILIYAICVMLFVLSAKYVPVIWGKRIK